MKNKRFLLGIMVFILGMTVAGYAWGQTLTITDIPPRLNNKYMAFEAYNDDVDVIGCRIITNDEIITAVRISNGRASVPLWEIDSNDVIRRYTGSGILDIEVYVFNSETLDGNEDELALMEFEAVRFSNGTATISFFDTIYYERFE